MNTNSFQNRHIGPSKKEQEKMLSALKIETLDQLIFWSIANQLNGLKYVQIKLKVNEYKFVSK